MFKSLEALDKQLVQYFYLHRPRGADSFLLWATNNATAIAFLFLLILLVLYFYKKRLKYLYAMINIFMIIGIGALFSNFIKFTTKRLRPYEVLEQIPASLQIESGGYSFPSGHTTEVFALTVAIFLLLRNPYLRWASLFWALLIAYTRVAFGVHYPSDVLGGMLIGGGFAWLWLQIAPLKTFFKRLNE